MKQLRSSQRHLVSSASIMGHKRSSIFVCQPAVPHYRKPLFEELARQLHPLRVGVVADPALRMRGAAPLLHVRPDPPVQSFDARVYKVGPLWLQPGLVKAIVRERPQLVVLSWNVRAGELIPAILISRALGARVILWGHSSGRRGGTLSRALRRLSKRLAHRIWVYWPREPGDVAGPTPVTVIGNGHPVVHKPRSATAATSFAEREGISASPRLLFVGRVRRESALDVVIRALCEPRLAARRVELVVLGDGPNLEDLKRLADRLGVADRVRFQGPTYNPEIIGLWAALSTAGVLPAQGGLSFVHLALHGLPIFYGRNERLHGPEVAILDELGEGLGFDPLDPADAARVIDSGLNELGWLLDRGRALERRAHKHWTVSALAARMSDSIRTELGLT